MLTYLAVAGGGAVGALLRFSLVTHTSIPFAILFANVLGSGLMGILVGGQHASWLRLSLVQQSFLMVGLLGAFTTFSTFSLEAFIMAQEGQLKLAAAYVLASVVLAIAAFAIGYKLSALF